jgi:hypothetical protein
MSGLEIDETLRLIRALRSTETNLEKVKVVVTKVPPVSTVGQQARDALREAGIPVATSVVRFRSFRERDMLETASPRTARKGNPCHPVTKVLCSLPIAQYAQHYTGQS